MRLALMALFASPAALLTSCGSVSSTPADAAPEADTIFQVADSAPPGDLSGPPDAPPGTPDAAPIPDAPFGTPDAMPCIHCAELAMGGDFAMGCPASLDLYNAVIECLCLPTNCGDMECMAECTGGISPDPAPCDACIMMVISPGGACETQVNECFADM